MRSEEPAVAVGLERSIISDGQRDVWEEHIAWYATRTGLSVDMTWIREDICGGEDEKSCR